ncbi:hypothetical protein D7030_04810 [Flavobacteriaceae bacterium AU392]|nr:hypothetical protein D1817_11285 [Flavobacteriaceae bacterium]RKM85996.1 hypothetical protein D7030_04810 [Flavobacteriaceae bacterium AU392]
MKDEDKIIMDYLDGVISDLNDKKIFEEAKKVKNTISEIKTMSVMQVNSEVDSKLYKFIEEKQKRASKKNRTITYATAIAAIVLIFFKISNYNNLESNYLKLNSNTDKLAFIYNLNNKSLENKDIKWLEDELKIEKNPNIKIVIIDILNNYSTELDSGFFELLQIEKTPTVQMALLNTLQYIEEDLSDKLINFSKQNNLQPTVRNRTQKIINNIKKQ